VVGTYLPIRIRPAVRRARIDGYSWGESQGEPDQVVQTRLSSKPDHYVHVSRNLVCERQESIIAEHVLINQDDGRPTAQ
jgi:hypothetical protein